MKILHDSPEVTVAFQHSGVFLGCCDGAETTNIYLSAAEAREVAAALLAAAKLKEEQIK